MDLLNQPTVYTECGQCVAVLVCWLVLCNVYSNHMMPLGLLSYCYSNKQNVCNCVNANMQRAVPRCFITVIYCSWCLLMNMVYTWTHSDEMICSKSDNKHLCRISRLLWSHMSSSVSLWAVLLQTISSALKRMRLHILARSTTITATTHTARTHCATHTPRTVSILWRAAQSVVMSIVCVGQQHPVFCLRVSSSESRTGHTFLLCGQISY